MRTSDGVHFGPADGIRAFAILLVFFDHVGLRAPHRSLVTVGLSLASGGMGVAALFVLSGFLLSVPYLRAVVDGDRPFPSSRRYAQARFLRIYPLYVFAVVAIALFVALLERHTAHLTTWDVVSHLLFLNDLQPSSVTSISPVFWTMAIDVGFYAMLPPAAWWALRASAGHARAWRLKLVVRALTAVVLASIVYRLVAGEVLHPANAADVVVAIRNVPGMAGLFAIGILAQILVRESSARDILRKRAALVLTAAGAGAALYLTIALLLVLAKGIASFGMLAIDDTLAAIGAASLLVFVIVVSEHPLSRVLSSPAAATAASLSYGWYLFHPTALDAAQKLTAIASRAFGGVPAALAYAVMLFLTTLVLVPFCYAIHVWIEKPFLQRKERLRDRGRSSIDVEKPVYGLDLTRTRNHIASS